MNFPPLKDAHGYVQREGKAVERLRLIWDIYNWCGQAGVRDKQNPFPGNMNREHPVAWDLAQIFGAIAGGYVIELSPHYRGVQIVRKNKTLWEKVSKFVDLRPGQAALPYDEGKLGERWEQMNGMSAHEKAAEEEKKQRKSSVRKGKTA